MHRIDDAIVREGKLVLTDLPFAEGEHVHITVEKAPKVKRTIDEVRALLRGSVLKFDDPTEPMIPMEDWECLK